MSGDVSIKVACREKLSLDFQIQNRKFFPFRGYFVLRAEYAQKKEQRNFSVVLFRDDALSARLCVCYFCSSGRMAYCVGANAAAGFSMTSFTGAEPPLYAAILRTTDVPAFTVKVFCDVEATLPE